MGNFSGFNQSSERSIVSSLGNELAVDGAGLIGVNTLPDVTLAAGQSVDVGTVTSLPDITIAPGETVGITGEVEITNDVGNPIPISGAISAAPATLVPLGFEQITVGNTAVGLTVPALAEVALIQNSGSGGGSGGAVRWRDDGTSPTSSVGMIFAAGTQFEYNGDLDAIEFINISGSSEEVDVSYYRYA